MARIGAGDVVGVDFDNTIISYDDVIRSVAIRRGYVSAGCPTDKRSIRDLIRARPDGDIDWQRVQGEVYGPRIDQAVMIEGVESFFRRCAVSGLFVHIISHKTTFAGYDPTKTNLRQAALRWLQDQGAFSDAGLGLDPDVVWFASTRQEKLTHIRRLGCRVFIDDLAEVFSEPEFPPGVERILFDPTGGGGESADRTFQNWSQIESYLFNERA
jgi:hypothetical protein